MTSEWLVRSLIALLIALPIALPPYQDRVRQASHSPDFPTCHTHAPYTLHDSFPHFRRQLRATLNPAGDHLLFAYLVSGAGAGALAAALTNPLDVVKTRLQTQGCVLASPLTFCATSGAAARDPNCPVAAREANFPAAAREPNGHPARGGPVAAASAGGVAGGISAATGSVPQSVYYRGAVHAVAEVWREEGWRGFSRGVRLRMLIHAPSVAICWTTYESVKHALRGLS